MKRVLIIIVLAAVFATGCGLGEAAQNTTASVGTKNESTFNVDFEQIICDVFPISNSRQAAAVCQLTVMADAEKWSGADEPMLIYGTGQLTLSDKSAAWDDATPFKIEGFGMMDTCPLEKGWENNIFYPCGLPLMNIEAEFTTQIMEGYTALGLTAFGTTRGEITKNLLTDDGVLAYSGTSLLNKEGMVTFENASLLEEEGIGYLSTACQGLLIPNSSLATIIMIGELKDGQRLLISGVADQSGLSKVANPTAFSCNGENETTIYTDKNGMSFIEPNPEGLRLKLGGENISVDSFIILGFNLGMPPT